MTHTVPEEGFEPSWAFAQQILSLPRKTVPPLRPRSHSRFGQQLNGVCCESRIRDDDLPLVPRRILSGLERQYRRAGFARNRRRRGEVPGRRRTDQEEIESAHRDVGNLEPRRAHHTE